MANNKLNMGTSEIHFIFGVLDYLLRVSEIVKIN